MKPIIYPVLIVSLITCVVCCEKSNEKGKKPFSGELTSSSSCKSNLKSSLHYSGTPDSVSCIEYSFDKGNSQLTLKHVNAAFNCCPDSIYCKISLKGDTILIQEFEKKSQCNCSCIYDLDMQVNGLDLKKYQLKFIEPYVYEQNRIIFDINLADKPSGSYCVTRKQYPWQ
jgi:hypothetical protein